MKKTILSSLSGLMILSTMSLSAYDKEIKVECKKIYDLREKYMVLEDFYATKAKDSVFQVDYRNNEYYKRVSKFYVWKFYKAFIKCNENKELNVSIDEDSYRVGIEYDKNHKK